MIPKEEEAENEQHLHLRGSFYGGFPAVRAEKEAAENVAEHRKQDGNGIEALLAGREEGEKTREIIGMHVCDSHEQLLEEGRRVRLWKIGIQEVIRT